MIRKRTILVPVCIAAICVALLAIFARAAQGCDCFWPGVLVGLIVMLTIGAALYVAKRLTTRRDGAEELPARSGSS